MKKVLKKKDTLVVVSAKEKQTETADATPKKSAAEKGLLALYRYGFGYKSVMITLTDLLPESFQGLLWTNPLDDIRKRALMNTMDSLSERYGRSALVLAKGIDSNGDWQMKRRMLSPCWTTRIADIPKVK